MNTCWEFFKDFWKLIFYGTILYMGVVLSIFLAIIIIGTIWIMI